MIGMWKLQISEESSYNFDSKKNRHIVTFFRYSIGFKPKCLSLIVNGIASGFVNRGAIISLGLTAWQ